MRVPRFVFVVCALSVCAAGQIFTLSRDQMIRATSQNPFGRFEDGRPNVPADLLERMRNLTLEDVFGVLRRTEFRNQFEGDWQVIHPSRKLVGRAVTLQYMPFRPDLAEIAEAGAAEKGLPRGAHRRAIDALREGDVLVIDVFGNVDAGGPVGDNLATAIATFAKTGLVVDGAVRDLEGLSEIPVAIYCRGGHPAAVNNVIATGFNVPIRIGHATVMPGDLVFGDREGVYFIPPQFVEQIVRTGEATHIHDEWTQMKMKTGKYRPSDLYPTPTDPHLKSEYEDYLRKRLAPPAGSGEPDLTSSGGPPAAPRGSLPGGFLTVKEPR